MTYKQRNIALSEAANYSDRDAYISDLALSSMFDSIVDDQRSALIDALGRIWDAWNSSFRDLRTMTGLSQAKFADRFFIPKRSIENWETEERKPPDYVRLMIAEILGILPPIDEEDA